ncbi:hypothetical protein JG688_00008471 [Phytophthora aleatoria]|uniref:Uncharacterized protein n=1 Tax=Phytophthora aleatoria TaxID=2496075 RepID=A0A8J5INH5_9STRA|nr:hypothetical protein JG688_00008471 [Phytophthora aleatoria]
MDPNIHLLVAQGLAAGKLDLASLDLDEETFIALQRIQIESEDLSDATVMLAALTKAVHQDIASSSMPAADDRPAEPSTPTPSRRSLFKPKARKKKQKKRSKTRSRSRSTSRSCPSPGFRPSSPRPKSPVPSPASTEPLESRPGAHSQSLPAPSPTSPPSPAPASPAESSGPKSSQSLPIVDLTGEESDVEMSEDQAGGSADVLQPDAESPSIVATPTAPSEASEPTPVTGESSASPEKTSSPDSSDGVPFHEPFGSDDDDSHALGPGSSRSSQHKAPGVTSPYQSSSEEGSHYCRCGGS